MSPLTSTRSGLEKIFGGWPPPVLDPAGPYAGSITFLTWVLLAIAAGVLLLVGFALYVAFFGKQRMRDRLGGEKVIWGAGIILPIVVLTALLVWGLRLTGELSSGRAPEADIRIQVTGEMWWWRVAYFDRTGNLLFWDANEIHIPVGRSVRLDLRSGDVIHSLWVPRLSGKTDLIPGRTNTMFVQADKPGAYGGHCAEYCGGPHALMGIVVVADDQPDFQRFIAHSTMRERSSPPATSAGSRLFDAAGCAACHRIAGTTANGMVAPDLTFVGRRRTIGAGILPNNSGTLMGWISDSQAIKPGNRMPPFKGLSSQQLSALADYLEQQK